MNHSVEHFARSILHSYAQIMLQANSITGLLFLIAIGINSMTMLLGSILAIVSTFVVNQRWQPNLSAADKGLYGYNAALVGIAVVYFLPISFISLVLIIFSATLSVAIMHLILTKIPLMPAFTTPFILSTWLVYMIIDFAELTMVTHSSITGDNSTSFFAYIQASMRGLSQVMLQDYWLSGVIFFCALFMHARKAAAWALIGSLVGLLVATALSFPQERIMLGLYGFNSCLVAIVLGARYPTRLWLICLAIVLSVLLSRLFELFTLPALTAPFVITTLMSIALVKLKVAYDNKRSVRHNLL